MPGKNPSNTTSSPYPTLKLRETHWIELLMQSGIAFHSLLIIITDFYGFS